MCRAEDAMIDAKPRSAGTGQSIKFGLLFPLML